MSWKLSQDGKTASRTFENGGYESRLISAIPADELAQALPADRPTEQERRDAIQAQIDTLERTQLMPRITREALLILMASTAVGYSRLKDIDTNIVALRTQMAGIP